MTRIGEPIPSWPSLRGSSGALGVGCWVLGIEVLGIEVLGIEVLGIEVLGIGVFRCSGVGRWALVSEPAGVSEGGGLPSETMISGRMTPARIWVAPLMAATLPS